MTAMRRRLQRQQAVVLQQHERLARRFQVQVAVGRGVVVLGRDPGKRLGLVEQAEADACFQQAQHGAVDVGLGQQALLDRAHRGGGGRRGAVAEFAHHVRARPDRSRHGALRRVDVAVRAFRVDVGDGAAVGHDVPLEFPRIAQQILQERAVGARGHAVHGVVGAHEGQHMPFGHGGVEGGQVGFRQVARGWMDVLAVAVGLRPAVHGEVLDRGRDLGRARVGALQAANIGHAHARRQVWIFAIGLLTAAPARVAENIHVRRPHRQTTVQVGAAVGMHGLQVLGAELGADRVRHALDERIVPRGGQADRLREHGGVAGARDAVQAFAPPVVGGDAEPRDGGRRGLQLAGFFFQCHAGQQALGPRGGIGLRGEYGQGGQGQRQRHGGRDGGPGQVSRCHMRFLMGCGRRTMRARMLAPGRARESIARSDSEKFFAGCGIS
jgi:hypothetical protein